MRLHALIATAAGAAVMALPLAVSGAQEPPPGSPPPTAEVDPNPCVGPSARGLRCPDLVMRPPYNLSIDRRAVRGRTVLRAANSIDSRGRGPAALIGRRDGARTMDADQLIWTTRGTRIRVKTGARLYFQPIPGQYRYWKFADAARFELWRVDSRNRRVRLVRVGPKQNYCLRDLTRTRAMRFSPPRRYFPGCSQERGKRRVILGTSPGWSDIYPASYHQNWIDVTGLRGRYAFVHIADPKNGIHETDETNNEAEAIVSLPSGRVISQRQVGQEPPPAGENGGTGYR